MKSEEVQVSAAAVAARLGLTLRLPLTHKLNAFNYLHACWRAADIQQPQQHSHAFCCQMPSLLQTSLNNIRYTQILNIDLGSDLKAKKTKTNQNSTKQKNTKHIKPKTQKLTINNQHTSIKNVQINKTKQKIK